MSRPRIDSPCRAFRCRHPVARALGTGVCGIAAEGRYPVAARLAVATLGNVLDACVTYAMGRGAERSRSRRWFPASPAQMGRAQGWYGRRGAASLLPPWAPGGDIFALMAGELRLFIPMFPALTALAIGGRYLALAGILAPMLS